MILPLLIFKAGNNANDKATKITDALDRLHDYDRTIDLNYRVLVALSLALLPALK